MLTRRGNKKRKDFEALTVFISMVFILFRNMLFIPLLNIWRDFDDDDDEDYDNDEKANSCAIKIVLEITFEYNRYKKLLGSR